MTLKWDGHTHTEYCPHGGVEDVEALIQKAITLGFTRYSVTEHAPLPPAAFTAAGGDMEIWTAASMLANDVDHYLKKIAKLRRKYAADIEILVGFELDYFPDWHDWTKDFLGEYGPQITDSILSVHFLKGQDGLRAIDFSAEDYEDGLVSYYGSFQKAQEAYYGAILASLRSDLGPYKPKRLGHISLCQKYQKRYAPQETVFSAESEKLLAEILRAVKQAGYSLDLNTAGLFKEDCLEIYPPRQVVLACRKLEIPLVYGSDSHHLADVGRGYEQIQSLLS